ncbi:MAG: T9SS type A sorting domain-containing protein [Flavobacteriales bacterium]|nr:T9SS type A sorting domain-containing protein [Flavobacteriales bacterium]
MNFRLIASRVCLISLTIILCSILFVQNIKAQGNHSPNKRNKALIINFLPFQEICWSASKINLKITSDISPSNGIWQAIDSVGYESAAAFNAAMSGDDLMVSQTPLPNNGKSKTYMLKYTVGVGGDTASIVTPIIIRGKPTVKINSTPLQGYVNNPPYVQCELDGDISMSANIKNGIWSSDVVNAFEGNILQIGKIKTLNKPFYIRYTGVDTFGCTGKDSALIEIHAKQVIVLPPDTAFTWYAPQMAVNLKATVKNASDFTWVYYRPNGYYDDYKALNTTFHFSADEDSLTKMLIIANTAVRTGTSSNVCPYMEASMFITVHPVPKAYFDLVYDTTQKWITAKARRNNFMHYRWNAPGVTDTGKTVAFSTSAFTSEEIPIKLTVFNHLGDSASVTNFVNLKSGKVTVEETKILPIELYPNPVQDGFFIKTNETKILSISVLGADGKQINVGMDANGFVRCDYLKPGFYCLVVNTSNGKYSQPFIKE